MLLNIPLDYEKEWAAAGMPAYEQNDLEPLQTITVHFRTFEERELFIQDVLKQLPRTNTSLTMKWIWYPPQDYRKWTDKKAPPTNVPRGKYSIYVISKGRSDTLLTVRQLQHLGIHHFLVIEPQERAEYEAALRETRKGFTTILELPGENYGGGCSIPARNWVWDHSVKNGDAKHWILDDNIQGFFELNRNMKPKIRDYNPFAVVEKFVDRHNNVGLAGMNYEFFVQRRHATPPYYVNTRVYSCILIRNDLPFQWRGRYNEDTDLSLRVLKSGMATVLFNYVLAKKVTTGIMKGGNEAIYKLAKGDGRLKMAEALVEQHPDVTKITHKWKRWQHQVDYTSFKNNKLSIRK